jgi:nitrogen fixation protein FixH
MRSLTGSNQTDTPRDRWIPWAFVAGFAVIILVNGIMVYMAVASFTGLKTEDYYQRGLHYNDVLDAQQTQDALGWSVTVDSDQVGSDRIRISVKAADGEDRPLDGADVKVRLVRPVQAGYDMNVNLTSQGEGLYAADVVLPLRGQWDILAQIQHPSGSYRATKRIVTR